MTPKKSRSFITLRRELDDVLAWFEGDSTDVDEAVKQYTRATELLGELEDYLENTKNTVETLQQSTIA